MRIRQRDPIEGRAEGLCHTLPYITELVSREGVAIHFWVGETADTTLLEQALAVARANRDVVCATWSYGSPTRFWEPIEEMRE